MNLWPIGAVAYFPPRSRRDKGRVLFFHFFLLKICRGLGVVRGHIQLLD